MKTAILLLLLLPALALAQGFVFQQEYNTIPVTIDGWQPFCPWAGGYSESHPDYCDIDADGDLDLFIGKYSGYIDYYTNVGNASNANFYPQAINWDTIACFPNNSRSNPDFWDLDNDGDNDLLIGAGYVRYYRNEGTANQPNFMGFSDTLGDINNNWVFGTHVALADIDADCDADLVCGEYQGYLRLYRNIGTPDSFAFYLEQDHWLGISVGGYNGSADPTLVDIDHDGDLDLFVGDRYGKIWFYRNEGTAQQYNFVYVTNNYNNISVGNFASPEFADVDGDGDYDLLVGREPDGSAEAQGDIFFYRNVGTPQLAQYQLITRNYISVDQGWYTDVAFADIDADGRKDLFIANSDSIIFYHNTGTAQDPSFTWVTNNYQNLVVDNPSPFFCDIDADGDLDLFCGSVHIPNPPYPGLYLFLNRGTPQQADFQLYSSNLVPNSFDVVIYPGLADIDADDDYDLFICDTGFHFYFYRNLGTPQQFNFVLESNNWQGIIPTQYGGCARFWDVDGDGDLDLFLTGTDNIKFYRNVGTPQVAQMLLENTAAITGLSFQETSVVWAYDLVDIDADGYPDFFGGNVNGGVLFFRNITGQSPVDPHKERYHPQAQLSLVVGPQPGNPSTGISFTLPSPQNAELAVYNLLGAKIATLVSGYQAAGTKSIVWNAFDRASGVYIVTLSAAQGHAAAKVVVVK
jgi:hypothetical protein